MNSEIYGRIYKSFPMNKLFRLKSFFIICRFPIIVGNLSSIYNFSSKIMGRKFMNKLIQLTYGDIFLAGENCKELEACLRDLKEKKQLNGIADYAREFLTVEEEITEIDSIIQTYKDSIDSSIRVDENNSIAVKFSSFGNVDMFKNLNKIQVQLTLIENEIMLGKSNQEILSLLSDTKFTLETLEYLRKNHNKIYDLNLYEVILNQDLKLINLIRESFGLDVQEIENFEKFVFKLNERLLNVFDHALSQKCLIMVDAEQSYLKFITDVMVAYYFKNLNRDYCVLAQTLQCYLKTQQYDLVKWNIFCRENNLKYGLKIVRGAYMNEEARIAQKIGKSSPVCDSVEETHSNYNKSIEYLFENYIEGDKFCIATHNLDSIQLVGDLYKTKGRNENIFCAQLMGIAEHATGFCQNHNIKVAKYVPFGTFDILIPYLIRRAEESSMISKLKVQNDLLNEEIALRLKIWNKL